MHQKGTPWSPEEIEAMRRELLEEDKTLEEISKREGVTGERIRQKVGNLNRGHSRSETKTRRVKALYEAGKSDQQIADELQRSLVTARHYRIKAGFRLPNARRRHTREHALWCIRKWVEMYGYTPAAADWNPGLAKSLGHEERAQRFRKFKNEYDCPVTGTILELFGSWLGFIRESGLLPAPRGFAARGFHSSASRRNNNWRPTVPDSGWTPEAILAKEEEWERRFGREPTASDWGAGNAFSKGPKNHEPKARFNEVNPPWYGAVVKYFGSFSAMLEEARKRHQAA